MKFIASWIELIIAKLFISMRDVSIKLWDSCDKASRQVAFELFIAEAKFFNSHPDNTISTESSISISQNMQSSHSTSRFFNDKKVKKKKRFTAK
jgi:hypothetical protein